MTYQSGSQHVLIVATSWGYACAGVEKWTDEVFKGLYTVFVRISHYREWIEAQMNSPKYCGSGPDAEDNETPYRY